MGYNYNKCPECGYESNRDLEDCPSCGYDLKRYKKYIIARMIFDEKRYKAAADAFLALGDFRDSAAYVEKSNHALYDACVAKFELDNFLKLMYTKGLQKRTDDGCELELKNFAQTYNVSLIDKIKESFESLEVKYDSEKYIIACDEAVKEYERLQGIIGIEKKYENGQKLIKDKNYEKAIQVFKSLGDYKDSAQLIKKAEKLYAVYLEQENIRRAEVRKHIKRDRIIHTIIALIGLVVLAGLVLLGINAIKTSRAKKLAEEEAKYSAQNIVMTIEDKVESSYDSEYSDGYVRALVIKLENNSTLEISEVRGELKVYSATGVLLITSDCTFSGGLDSGEEGSFTLDIDRRSSDEVLEFYYADFEDLSATFKLTDVVYIGKRNKEQHKEYDEEPVTVLELSADSDGISATEKSYQEAISLFNQKHYSDAMALFDGLGYYKESVDYYNQCITQLEEEKYNTAIGLLESKSYAEAFEAFSEIKFYKDSYEKIQEVINAGLKKAEDLADTGDYSGAYVIISNFSSDDEQLENKISRAKNAYYYAKNGDFETAMDWGLKTVILPYGIEIIPQGYFSNNTSIQKVVLPDSVKTIDQYAFDGCRNLESIVIPDSVTEIGYRAFYNCSKLTRATFENAEGWKVIGGPSIASSDLSEPGKAAEYLKHYYNNRWTRE